MKIYTRIYLMFPALFSLGLLLHCTAEAPPPVAGFKDYVKTHVAQSQSLVPEIQSFGTITFFRKADVAATSSGVIETLAAEEGTLVREGQTLAVINNVQLLIQKRRTESQIKQARSAVELSEAKLREAKLQVEARLLGLVISELDLKQKKIELDDLERLLKNKEKLYTVGGLSDEGLHSFRMQFHAEKNKYELAQKSLEAQRLGLRDEDIRAAGLNVPAAEGERVRLLQIVNTQTLGAEVKVAQAGLDAAATELEAIDQLLKETVIRSPVSGVVGMRYLELGERVQPDAKLFTVLDTSRVYAVFPVTEGEAASITAGMNVELTIDALNKLMLNAKIELISPLVDPQTGNLSVKALLPNKNLQLKPGMFARARVIAGQPRQTILLPKTCLLKKEGKQGELYTVVRNRVFPVKVQLGIEKENLVEIVAGIKPEDAVVDAPSPLLKEGQDVEIKND